MLKMANFEDYLSIFPYPASYLASAHKDYSEGASANKKKFSHGLFVCCVTMFACKLMKMKLNIHYTFEV